MKHLYSPLLAKAAFTRIKQWALTMLVLSAGLKGVSQAPASRFAASVKPAASGSTALPRTMPSSLVSFTAVVHSPSRVRLDWTVSSDREASHFIVQRSVDGKEFVDQVVIFTDESDNNPNKHFYYADNAASVKSGTVYYRLKMVGLDGKSSYSQVQLVRLGKPADQSNLLTGRSHSLPVTNSELGS